MTTVRTEPWDALEKLYSLKEYEPSRKKEGYYGLLYPNKSLSVWAYGWPALEVSMYVTKDKDGLYHFQGCIASIDDSGVSIYGPAEKIDKARTRLKSFKQFIEDCSFQAPDDDNLKNWGIQNNCWPDYW